MKWAQTWLVKSKWLYFYPFRDLRRQLMRIPAPAIRRAQPISWEIQISPLSDNNPHRTQSSHSRPICPLWTLPGTWGAHPDFTWSAQIQHKHPNLIMRTQLFVKALSMGHALRFSHLMVVLAEPYGKKSHHFHFIEIHGINPERNLNEREEWTTRKMRL